MSLFPKKKVEYPFKFFSTEERKTWTSWMTWGWVNYQQKLFLKVNYTFKLRILNLSLLVKSEMWIWMGIKSPRYLGVSQKNRFLRWWWEKNRHFVFERQ